MRTTNKLCRVMAVVGLTMLFLTGCTGTNGIWFFNGDTGEKKLVSENSIHSESEIRQFALLRLKEKYDMEFILEEDTLSFTDYHDNPKHSSVLYGFAHAREDVGSRCYFRADETGSFRDNFSINPYKNDIIDVVNAELEAFGLEGTVEVDYAISSEILPQGKDVNELLHSTSCEIYFMKETAYNGEPESCIEMIRQWMDFLYSRDYKWYFELKEAGKGEIIFALDPVDNHFSKSEDWKDETIIEYIRSNVRNLK